MKVKEYFHNSLQFIRYVCSSEFRCEARQFIRAYGIWDFLCTYIGVVIGYQDWKDGREVRKYRLTNGNTLAYELSIRLKENGVNFPICWAAWCYGPTAIITAYLGKGESRAVAFDYDHFGGIFVLNPLAAFLFPELPKPAPPRAYPIDWIGPEALK